MTTDNRSSKTQRGDHGEINKTNKEIERVKDNRKVKKGTGRKKGKYFQQMGEQRSYCTAENSKE